MGEWPGPPLINLGITSVDIFLGSTSVDNNPFTHKGHIQDVQSCYMMYFRFNCVNFRFNFVKHGFGR